MLSEDEIFSCLKCGDCCKGYGGTYVTPEDVLALSAFLQTDSGRFIEAYCTISGGDRFLARGRTDTVFFSIGFAAFTP
jgi:uncharacterized protein